MKNKTKEAMKSELVNIIKELSPEDAERLRFVVMIATPEQKAELFQRLEHDDFRGTQIREWVDSNRPLVMEVV